LAPASQSANRDTTLLQDERECRCQNRLQHDADTLSDRHGLGIRTYRRDSTDDLMAENRGLLRVAPVIVQGGEFGVTHSAGFDSNIYRLDPEPPEINGFQHHRLFRRLRDPCVIVHRVPFSQTLTG
jgi:hypothetical protein